MTPRPRASAATTRALARYPARSSRRSRGVTTRAAEEVTVGRKGNTRSRRAQRGDQIERSRRSPARFRASQRFPSPAFKVRFQGSLSPLFSVVGSRHHVVTFSSCFPSGFDDLRARSEAQICGRETRTIAVERSRTPTSDVDRVHERVHHESPPPPAASLRKFSVES
eukprot:29239-Pelagococcus_subviridis.AAC.10